MFTEETTYAVGEDSCGAGYPAGKIAKEGEDS